MAPANRRERKFFPPAHLPTAEAAIPPRRRSVHLLLIREIVSVGNPNTFSNFGDLDDNAGIDSRCEHGLVVDSRLAVR